MGGEDVLIGAASFEARSLLWLEAFMDEGGDPESVYIADVVEQGEAYASNLARIRGLGVRNVATVDRFSSAHLWSWVVQVVEQACTKGQNVTIDATCIPRELLGMLLFALSVRRNDLNRVSVAYVAPPAGGYATQNSDLPGSARWLSKGVAGIRSIVGYPGVFRSERPAHLVVLAGHERERTLRLIEFMEPKRLTISGESAESSTVSGASSISKDVASELKRLVPVPEIGDIDFSSSSIESVYRSLGEAQLGRFEENVAISAMNTKLSFIGAALYALADRTVRLMYAVPTEYNPAYTHGIGSASRHDVTSLLQKAKTQACNAKQVST